MTERQEIAKHIGLHIAYNNWQAKRWKGKSEKIQTRYVEQAQALYDLLAWLIGDTDAIETDAALKEILAESVKKNN